MLAFNRSLLNSEYTLINVLMALASIISMCNLHVTFLSKITRMYFALFTTLNITRVALYNLSADRTENSVLLLKRVYRIIE
jgi:hypothetical protein